MEYEVIKLNNILYQGYHTKVDLNELDKTDFKALWDRVFDETKNSTKNRDDYYIGYEDYSNLSKTNKVFDYYALAPSYFFESNKNDEHCFLTMKKGSYLLFENKIATHGPHFFKDVYTYIEKNAININRSCDFEFIPTNFNRDNPESLIYVGLRLSNVKNE